MSRLLSSGIRAWRLPTVTRGLTVGSSHDRQLSGIVMGGFLAGPQSYFASEERAREAELADARPAFDPRSGLP